jgi:hypothetical protein
MAAQGVCSAVTKAARCQPDDRSLQVECLNAAAALLDGEDAATRAPRLWSGGIASVVRSAHANFTGVPEVIVPLRKVEAGLARFPEEAARGSPKKRRGVPRRSGEGRGRG